MSFAEGNTSTVNVRERVDALVGKYGSFIVFVWTNDPNGPCSAFSISQNNTGIDWKRLSCVKDVDNVFICPTVKDNQLYLGVCEGDIPYTSFNVKILG